MANLIKTITQGTPSPRQSPPPASADLPDAADVIAAAAAKPADPATVAAASGPFSVARPEPPNRVEVFIEPVKPGAGPLCKLLTRSVDIYSVHESPPSAELHQILQEMSDALGVRIKLCIRW